MRNPIYLRKNPLKKAMHNYCGSISGKIGICILPSYPASYFCCCLSNTPMYGIIIAFKDFNIFEGMAASLWVGWKHFEKLFSSDSFLQVFQNTLIISVYKIVFLFPLPIVVTILLNELKCKPSFTCLTSYRGLLLAACS
jgi:ABC-type polysaccharide transport system permease subunit